MEKSREEMEKECAEANARADQYQHQVQRLENRIRYYTEGERKKRNHRLITRGADVESVAPEVRGMSQFYMRFIRYTSTEYKDIYFLTYAGSLESNLMQMVVAKEKLNLFMKGKDADLDEIYDKFGIDYNLMSLLMRRELDDEGHFQIRWGEQLIA